jgi:hypothetical protein
MLVKKHEKNNKTKEQINEGKNKASKMKTFFPQNNFISKYS